MDFTVQSANPQFASNLKIKDGDKEIGFKAEAAYVGQVIDSTSVKHKFHYLVQIFPVDWKILGNLGFVLEESGWHLTALTSFPLQNEPLALDAVFKQDIHEDVLKAEFVIRKLDLPFIDISDCSFFINADAMKSSFLYRGHMKYNLIGTEHLGEFESKLVAKSPSDGQYQLTYHLISSEFSDYNHEALLEFIRLKNGKNMITRIESNAYAKWGVVPQPEHEISFHQLYQRTEKKGNKVFLIIFMFLSTFRFFHCIMIIFNHTIIIINIRKRVGIKTPKKNNLAISIHLYLSFTLSGIYRPCIVKVVCF